MTEKEKYHGTRPEISQEAEYYILEQHEEDNAITTDAKRG